MEIKRIFVPEGTDPFSMFEYEQYDCEVKNWSTGVTKVIQKDCEVPKAWSKNARDILITKYFRKAGVPSEIHLDGYLHKGVPSWLIPGAPVVGSTYGGETSVKQVVNRLAGHWTYGGWMNGYFEPTEEQFEAAIESHPVDHTLIPEQIKYDLHERNAKAFYDEIVYMLLNQMWAPNSPQFFNTGLNWAYGITGKSGGHFYVDLPHKVTPHGGDIKQVRHSIKTSKLRVSQDGYTRTQAHACFILGVEDTMLGENGIADYLTRESRIFKFGSGSGANLSKLRAKSEKLAGGGTSSGLLSWMRTADYNAGAIKSGGTTRRAAKMVCLDLEHPDVLDFIDCKVHSEIAVAAMVAGSKIVNDHCQKVMDAWNTPGDKFDSELTEGLCEHDDVPPSYIDKATSMAIFGLKKWPGENYDTHFEGKAYEMVPFQNANNSVRIPSSFYEAVDADVEWATKWRTNGETAWAMPARELEDRIAQAAWFCADPGVQYDTIINEHNVTPNDGRIDASNPCSEFMRPDGSGCNLASQRLLKYVDTDGNFQFDVYRHAVRLITTALDITICISQLPDADTAIGVYLYRDIGLGFADLGGLVMGYGLPYDSDEGRALAGLVTATMQGQMLLTSAEIAGSLGAYPRFQANREAHLRDVRNAMAVLGTGEFEGLSSKPPMLEWDHLKGVLGDDFDDLVTDTNRLWYSAYTEGCKHGYRNAQGTVIAPTGTIGILMDCDTTGVEPLFALMVFKKLVGGGGMTFPIASSIYTALRRKGYSEGDLTYIAKFIAEHNGHLPGDILKTEDRSIFSVAVSNDPLNPEIHWKAHLRMMAAVQPFIGGAISKTINMSSAASIDDVKECYRMGHDLRLKAVALYRDGCKLSQPMNIAKKAKPAAKPITHDEAIVALREVVAAPGAVKAYAESRADVLLPYLTETPIPIAAPQTGPRQITERFKLPNIRQPGIDICVQVGPGNLYLKTTRYEGGLVGEIWATYSKDQGEFQAMLSLACKTANVALQKGVPLADIIASWEDSTFEPNGMVYGHPNIKTCKSILNLIAKLLKFHEMNDHSVANVKPVADIPAEVSAEPARLEFKASTWESSVPDRAPAVVGEKCPECRSPNYLPSGTCKRCTECGYSGGCG